MIKIDLNSTNYFSTTNANTSDNRTYALDSSFFKEGSKYVMTYNFLAKNKTLYPYPPVALSAANGAGALIAGQAYGNGQYTITASSEAGVNYNWKPFDKLPAPGNYWRTGGGVYSIGGATPGSYTGTASTTMNGVPNILGEWVQIQLPNAIVLTDYFFDFNRSNSTEFRDYSIVGSNDGVTFNLIHQNTVNLPASQGVLFSVPSLKPAYSYYRFIARSGAGANGYIELSEWILYEDRARLSSGLLSINMGSFSNNYKASNRTQKQNTYLAGLLRVKNRNLYCKAYHQGGMFFNNSLNNNFITINLLQMDGITPLNLVEPYYLTLFFNEIT